MFNTTVIYVKGIIINHNFIISSSFYIGIKNKQEDTIIMKLFLNI